MSRLEIISSNVHWYAILFGLAYVALTALAGLRRDAVFWPLVVLGSLLLFNLFVTPGFFEIQVREVPVSTVDIPSPSGGSDTAAPAPTKYVLYGSLIDILNRGAPVMLLAIGMTLVIATGGIDLSVGSVMALAGSLAWFMLDQNEGLGTSLPLVLAGTLVICGLAGMWNGALVTLVGVQPIVATLILMVAGRGIAQRITSTRKPPIDNEAFHFLGTGYFLSLPVTVWIVVGVLLATAVLTRKTAMALFIESVGSNEKASRNCGINVHAVKLFVYGFCAVCAGFAGIIRAADDRQANPMQTGLYLELDAILAVVIGGTALTGGRFFLFSSVVGAVLIRTLTVTLDYRNVSDYHTLMVKALVVLAVCLLQSEGFRRMVFRRRGK